MPKRYATEYGKHRHNNQYHWKQLHSSIPAYGSSNRIPIHIQYLKGSYGTVDLGATMALILLSIVPVIVFYLSCQKHIIKGVAAGAVKG